MRTLLSCSSVRTLLSGPASRWGMRARARSLVATPGLVAAGLVTGARGLGLLRLLLGGLLASSLLGLVPSTLAATVGLAATSVAGGIAGSLGICPALGGLVLSTAFGHGGAEMGHGGGTLVSTVRLVGEPARGTVPCLASGRLGSVGAEDGGVRRSRDATRVHADGAVGSVDPQAQQLRSRLGSRGAVARGRTPGSARSVPAAQRGRGLRRRHRSTSRRGGRRRGRC